MPARLAARAARCTLTSVSDDLQAAVARERALAHDAAAALEVCGRRLDALVAQSIIRRSEIDQLEAERERLASSVRAQADAIAALRRELDDARAALANAEAALETSEQHRASAADAIGALRARLGEPRYVVADRISGALRPFTATRRLLRRVALAMVGGTRPGSSR